MVVAGLPSAISMHDCVCNEPCGNVIFVNLVYDSICKQDPMANALSVQLKFTPLDGFRNDNLARLFDYSM